MKLIIKYIMPLKAVLVVSILAVIVIILRLSGIQNDTSIAELSEQLVK